MRIRYFHTEDFRLAAIYVAVFAASVAALGAFVLPTLETAMRDQVVQYAEGSIAAIRDGYATEGVFEAHEVALQLMAGRSAADFILLQQNGRKLAGNLPAMRPVMGAQEIGRPDAKPGAPGRRVLGVGAQIAPGLYAFAGSDLGYVAAVRGRVLNVMLWLFGGALLLAGMGGAMISRSFLARTDAIARTVRRQGL